MQIFEYKSLYLAKPFTQLRKWKYLQQLHHVLKVKGICITRLIARADSD